MLRYTLSSCAAAAAFALSLGVGLEGSVNAFQARPEAPPRTATPDAPPPPEAPPRTAPPADRNDPIPDERDDRTKPPRPVERVRERPAKPTAEEAAIDAKAREAAANSIVAILNQGESQEEKNHFKTFAKAVKAAGLEQRLRGEGPFTVFAPTDEAFARLPEGQLEELMKDQVKLKALLLGHIIRGQKVAAAYAGDVKDVKTIHGEPITVAIDGGKTVVNDANIVRPDIEASNGVIHGIDRLLMVDLNAKFDDKEPTAVVPVDRLTPVPDSAQPRPGVRIVNETPEERAARQRREERREENREERREERRDRQPANPK